MKMYKFVYSRECAEMTMRFENEMPLETWERLKGLFGSLRKYLSHYITKSEKFKIIEHYIYEKMEAIQ